LESSTFGSRRARRHPFGNALHHRFQFFELFVDVVEPSQIGRALRAGVAGV
jgi:hypothetical protein